MSDLADSSAERGHLSAGRSTPRDSALHTQDSSHGPKKPTSTGRKRLKVAQACHVCRAKKIRCDGLQPQCGTCRRRKLSELCQYESEPARPLSNKKVIQSLQDRLAELEGRLDGGTQPRHATDLPLEAASAPSHASHCSSTFETEGDEQAVAQQLLNFRKQPEQEQRPQIRDTSDKDDPSHSSIDLDREIGPTNPLGMTCLPSPEDASSLPESFYGKSSAASLLLDVQDRLQYRDQSFHARTIPGPPVRLNTFQFGPGELGTLGNSDDLHMPPRQIADRLLELYWTRVQCLYPYLHWPTLVEGYDRLWMSQAESASKPQPTGIGLGGPQCPPRLFYASLNVMFALATQFSSGSAQTRSERALPFARRARYLLQLENMDYGNIALIQGLLIMAHYLQSTNMPSRCWNTAGLALRMAQGLGLHLNVNNGNSQLAGEMRRRVWHGCVCLDVFLAMTLGRPTLNSRKSNVDLPAMLPEEQEPALHGNLLACSTAIPFFNQTCRLYKILENILIHIYDPWKEAEASGNVEIAQDIHDPQQAARVATLDAELNHFEATLPEELSWTNNAAESGENSILQRQRNILRTRLLHSRVILYRPSLVKLCQTSGASSSRTTSTSPSRLTQMTSMSRSSLLSDRCCIACVENAQALIEHVSNSFKGVNTGAAWFSSYYVYHSAMVLALAEVCSPIKKQLHPSSLAESWSQCKDYLDRNIKHDPESFKYLQALIQISKHLNLETTGLTTVESPTPGKSGHEWLQGAAVNHIFHSCLDPSVSSWLDEPALFDRYTPFAGEIGEELGLGSFRDDGTPFTGGEAPGMSEARAAGWFES